MCDTDGVALKHNIPTSKSILLVRLANELDVQMIPAH